MTPKRPQTCSSGARSRLLAGHGSDTMFLFARKSLDKRAAVLAQHGLTHKQMPEDTETISKYTCTVEIPCEQ